MFKTCRDCGKPIKGYYATRCKKCSSAVREAERHPPIIIVCAYCGKTKRIKPSMDTQHYCSMKCKKAALIETREIICPVCGKRFVPDRISRGETHTCSVECRGKLRSIKQPKIELICKTCGKTFYRHKSQAESRQPFCSQKCYNVYQRTIKPVWVRNGRKFIRVNGKIMFEHRHIMEQYIDRTLKKNEVVHHINGDPMDNRIENLQLMKRSEHTSLHNMGKSRKGQMPMEARKRLSERMKGNKYGSHPRSEELKKQISQAVKKVRAERFWSSHKK